MTDQTLSQRLDKIQVALTQMQLRLSSVMAGRRVEEPIQTQWIRPKAAVVLWGLSESTLRKYRTKKWTDGSFLWVEGVHWRKRKGYNRAVVDHWFAHRLNQEEHQSFINRWLKTSNQQVPNR
ncbi:MAG: hypothetical protein AAF821_26660 [Cyanobacteria bacterium P01_D01_bin.156]